MFKSKRKAFTLIELIATLVIMAIIALIVTPLVMNIIRSARTSADKRSIDAYGRSIELAVAGYLLDTGRFPTEVSQLTIEYSGNDVVCSTTQLNSDSSVYLAGCTVAGRSIDYSYGSDKTSPVSTYQAYSVGDEVTYNNVDYYVIENSGTSSDTVKLLKKTFLTADEINTYGGVGTANNHVNMYFDEGHPYYQRADTSYSPCPGVAYYTSETCGYPNGSYVGTGCTTDYNDSEIKYIVDAWASDNVINGLQEARLLTLDEIIAFDYEYVSSCPTCGASWRSTEDTPTWLSNPGGRYWTLSQFEESSDVYVVGSGDLSNSPVYQSNYSVRPVIVLDKSAL